MPILLQEKKVDRWWEYKIPPSHSHECVLCELGLRPRNSFSRSTEIEISLQYVMHAT
jgi:hypothetical protein